MVFGDPWYANNLYEDTGLFGRCSLQCSGGLLAIDDLSSFDAQDVRTTLNLPLCLITYNGDTVVVVPEILRLRFNSLGHGVIYVWGFTEVTADIPRKEPNT